MYKKKGYNSGVNLGNAGMGQYSNQIIKKETLYNGNHDLGNGIYQVEILIS